MIFTCSRWLFQLCRCLS